MINPTSVQLIAALLFALAVIHTFSTKYFEHLAHTQPRHAGVWHLLGEVEVVFGFWAMILIVFIFAISGKHEAINYLESRDFTEPMFVFVIMVIAGTRPVLDFAAATVQRATFLFPCRLRWPPFSSCCSCYLIRLKWPCLFIWYYRLHR